MALLLVAIMPSILYSGHWTVHTLPAEALEAAVPDHDHSGHHHGIVASGPGFWWTDEQPDVALDGAQERFTFAWRDAPLAEPPAAPIFPPPRIS